MKSDNCTNIGGLGYLGNGGFLRPGTSKAQRPWTGLVPIPLGWPPLPTEPPPLHRIPEERRHWKRGGRRRIFH